MADVQLNTRSVSVKEAYEANPNTNAFTDDEKTKLSNVPSTFDKDTVGLGNVDNTSDADKPVSNATQTALNGKISSDPTGITGAAQVLNAVSMTQAAYDALPTKDAQTLYFTSDE